MPGFGKSGTSRISFFRSCIRFRYTRKLRRLAACVWILVALTWSFINNAAMALKVWIAAGLAVLAGCAAFGQPAAARFDVASVKRAESGGSPGDIPRTIDRAHS